VLVPVTVRVYVPRATEALTVIVNVDVADPPEGGVTEVGLKVAVTPVGAPETDKATAELKPFREVTVMVDVPEAPCTIVREAGEADIEKSGAAETVRLMVAVWVLPPPEPVTVRVYVPVAAEADTVMVRVDVAVPPEVSVTEVGLNVAVTPVGAPETDRLTVPAKPLREVRVMVDVPELPCAIVSDVGEAEMEKSGGAVTVKLTVAVCVNDPLVPVTVSV